jgi:hypothetical protein
MKRKHWFLVPFLGLFLSLGLSSCERDVDKFSARLIDESELNDVPLGALSFKWQGVIGNQQTLTMWRVDKMEDQDEEPYIFRIGFGRTYSPVNDNYFIYQTDQWTPSPGFEYYWNITTYYDGGDIEVSEARKFTPNPS